MERVCFRLQVKPELIEEYRDRHASVSDDMLQAIADAGRRNYSLFMGSDGLLVGVYETDDDARSRARLAADDRARAWETEMSRFFVGLDGRADQGAEPLTEVFNLEHQRSAAG